jgi:hypothetical protein
MPTGGFRPRRTLGLTVPVVSLLLAGCGGSGHAGQPAAQRLNGPTPAEQVSFLRTCSRGVGAGALGDAAVCQCTLAQLEAETNRRTFQAAVTAWRGNVGGAGFRSTVAQVIARCQGQQQIGSTPPSGTSTQASTVATAHTLKISTKTYARQFRWPTSARSMVHTCLDGTAVANGMSCALSHAIAQAFGEYPDTKTPVVRHLRLVDPSNGRVVSVQCGVSGHKDASALCNAPQHQKALLPAPDYSD